MPTILLIDDDIAALSALTTTLEGAGFTVNRSTSINQARHLLDEAEPDLVVLEVDTDRGEGWGLLRDIVRFQGPPTIVVTHRGREDEIVEALSIGAVDVLPKPFRSNELLARIRSRLGPAPQPAASAGAASSPVHIRQPEAEPVFISHADEQQLLAMPSAAVPDQQDEGPGSLGTRFHTARQQRKLTLVQVNLDTKIPIWYLQAMEEEKFALLPRGPASADMVRTYAEYLRLDSDRALTEFRGYHDTQPWKPLPALGGPLQRREISPWAGIGVAIALALALGIGAIWFLARDEVAALGGNLRGLVVRSTPTAIPSPTTSATITPRPPTVTPVRISN